MYWRQGLIRLGQCSGIELTGQLRQLQPVDDKPAARLGQGQRGGGAVVVGVQHVEQRALADLVAGARGVLPGVAGNQGLLQRAHLLGARLQAQPGGMHLARDGFARGVQLRLGFVVARQAFFFLGRSNLGGGR